jgi:hypothetical protein
VFVAAAHDAYVPPDGIEYLHRVWQGSTMQTIGGGHVSNFLSANATFRSALRTAFNRL